MENADGIEIKANMKNIGDGLVYSKKFEDAEDFFTKLITNMYFINDYYPYQKLVEVYRKKKESDNVINTIEEFFKSDRYCNELQLLSFKLEFKNACKYSRTNFSEFNEYLEYFKEHGLKNKDKQNDPVPIATRIKTSKYGIKVKKQEVFDKECEKEELNLKYTFARKYGSDKETFYYLEQIWLKYGFGYNLTPYKKLCAFYDKYGQYEKVIEIANIYLNSNVNRSRSSPDWFKKKIKKAKSKLGKNSD